MESRLVAASADASASDSTSSTKRPASSTIVLVTKLPIAAESWLRVSALASTPSARKLAPTSPVPRYPETIGPGSGCTAVSLRILLRACSS